MTSNVDVCNQALSLVGIKKKITALTQDSVEAQTCNLHFIKTRDDLLRMAPWDCALKTANLVYITSSPGTPENTSPATALWERGQPAPPWAYEYQYPIDCLRACWMIPAVQTGFPDVPITAAVTGGVPSNYLGAPIRFKVQIDEFFSVTGGSVSVGGTGYAVFDVITLAGTPDGDPPIGAPAQLVVLTAPGGVIATVFFITQVPGDTILAGSYFDPPTGVIAQGSTSGSGTGASFTVTVSSLVTQRVILTNQEFAILAYVKQVTDPNVMDPLFIDAWIAILASRLAVALTGDKDLARLLIADSNNKIIEARKVDGNEGLTINDVTPDFIRIRGVNFGEEYSGAFSQFDWGPLWSSF